MIKSFHSKPLLITHTYIALVELSEGTVSVNIVRENGHNPGNSQMVRISSGGLVVPQGFDGDLGVENESGLSRARVMDAAGDIMMTHAEWKKKIPMP